MFAAAPWYLVCIVTIGLLTSGSSSVGISLNTTMPKTTMIILITEATTGLLMDKSVKNI